MSNEENLDTTSAPVGVPRRKVILNGAGLAAAGLVVGAAIPLTASAVSSRSTDSAPQAGPGRVPQDPVVVHLRDANAGQFDLFVGTTHVRFTDRAMAARLTEVATNA
ncbi:MAG: hypothetical protein ACRDSN_24095 [Pseudonocardiaceae bacterium]